MESRTPASSTLRVLHLSEETAVARRSQRGFRGCCQPVRLSGPCTSGALYVSVSDARLAWHLLRGSRCEAGPRDGVVGYAIGVSHTKRAVTNPEIAAGF